MNKDIVTIRNGILLLLSLSFALTSVAAAGICEKLSPTSDNMGTYGRDYRPRIGFQTSADDASCAVPLAAGTATDFTLFAWNLSDGISGANFRLVTDGDIVDFVPGDDFGLMGSAAPIRDGGLSVLDVILTGDGVCGPVALGTFSVDPAAGADGIFVDVDGYSGLGNATYMMTAGGDVPAVSPFHGAYAGARDLYHCQPSLCAEPLAAITDLTSLQSGGEVIELGWTAGDGDVTMIRYRSDGVHPTSVYDGDLLVAFPASEGAWQSIVHTNPEVPHYWYTAFNVRLDGDDVDLGSLLECGSFATGTVDESIRNETLSWGAVKQRFR